MHVRRFSDEPRIIFVVHPTQEFMNAALRDFVLLVTPALTKSVWKKAHPKNQNLKNMKSYCIGINYIYMSYGRNYLFGENAMTKCGWSPIGFQCFRFSGHQHQSRCMQFTLWEDWSRIAGEQAKMREFLLTAHADNYKIFDCALVHLGYYRHLWKHEKEDSTFFGSQQGQQTMNFELWSKPFLPQSGM